jgi:acyl-CoA synthetase (AMP-forming)/AMP-acid ligase II
MIYSGYVDVGVVQPHSWIETGDYAYIQNNQNKVDYFVYMHNLRFQSSYEVAPLQHRHNLNKSYYWIETGDYAYIQNNQLYLVSRKSDRLIIGGKNIYPNVIAE